MNRTRPLVAIACTLTSLAGAATIAHADGGVHHPACATIKDQPHTVDTAAAGNVWIKAGPNHYDAGYHGAGWDVPATYNGKDTSHYDVCPSGPPTTTTTPPTTTTVPPTTIIPTTTPPTTTTPITIPPTTEPETTIPDTTPDTTVAPTTPPPTTEPPTTTAPADTFGSSIDATVICGTFRGTAANTGTRGRAVFTVYVDGAQVDEFTLRAGETRSIVHTFAEDSGVHTVQVDWAEGPSGWTIASDCKPNTEIADPPVGVPPAAAGSTIIIDPPAVVELPQTS